MMTTWQKETERRLRVLEGKMDDPARLLNPTACSWEGGAFFIETEAGKICLDPKAREWLIGAMKGKDDG